MIIRNTRERERESKTRLVRVRRDVSNVNSNYNRDPTVDIKTHRVKSTGLLVVVVVFVVYGFQSNSLEK